MKNSSRTSPETLENPELRYDTFDSGRTLFGQKKGRLPAMGWNSWNAFGSGNTEELTLQMAEKFLELGLDRAGYRYLVLDDGCYAPERVDGRLANEPGKFPSGFRALSDRIHAMGLKFGMYNCIGPNLCAGAAVGTCGHEREDAESYVSWGVDFLKVDNCYYLWDNATFADARNARYVYAPAIAGISLTGPGFAESYMPGSGITVTGAGIAEERVDGKLCYTGIGTFDGTGPERTPVGIQSGELTVEAEIPENGRYELRIDAVCGEEPGRGSWIEILCEHGSVREVLWDGFWTDAPLSVDLPKGHCRIRFANHRRQENTLTSYSKLLEGLNEVSPGYEIRYSVCEWGKTQPQNWAKKVGDSWRILNDITFDVGGDGKPGSCRWAGDYTDSITAQYNKCVIMDEFAGLDKGWNDPDMTVFGMDGLSLDQNETHMAMWCMMNAPLMLGLDLRRVRKGDALHRIIANAELIALDQDPLGVPAKRIRSSLAAEHPDTDYLREPERTDILAKPLADGSVALSFLNLSEGRTGSGEVTAEEIMEMIGTKMPAGAAEAFRRSPSWTVKNLWTGEKQRCEDGCFRAAGIVPCGNVTVRIFPEKRGECANA